MDIVVYREPGFKEAWYLLIPAGKEESLLTAKVVHWYRSRMRIEVTFRDFKAHLGLRGLSLQVRPCVRLERMLMLLAIAYVVLLSLGIGPFGQRFRTRMELLRCKSRHGALRALIVLSIALAGIFHALIHRPGVLLPLPVQAFRRLFRRPVSVLFTTPSP